MVSKEKSADLLSEEFLSGYKNFPDHMNALGKFVYLRTYSRFLPELGRRETYKETVKRATEYNIELAIKHLERFGIPYEMDEMVEEAELLFDRQFNTKQFLSGRTLWVGGAENGVADKFPLANFNCSFTNAQAWEDMAELFYLLLVGTGVGFKCTKAMAKKIDPVRTDITLINETYEALPSYAREDGTKIYLLDDKTVKIEVGDSKEGWVHAKRLYWKVITGKITLDDIYAFAINEAIYFHPDNIDCIRINYNMVRPNGERLKTFGGTASGPEPLMEMFLGFDRVIKNQIDPTLAPLELAYSSHTKGTKYYHVRPIHLLDIGNLVGNNVVVGGVRRTAEIFLFDADDFECLWAKYGVNGYWKEKDFVAHEEFMAYCDANGINYPAWFSNLSIRNYDETVNVDYATGETRRESDGSLSPYNFGTGQYHRSMSNNSIAFTSKPDRKHLHMIYLLMKKEGEPGFVNLEEAARRRLKAQGIKNPSRKLLEWVMFLIGLNPCAEILLRSKGVCNLTTVNAMAFVNFNQDGTAYLDEAGILASQRLSARSGIRMTLATLELPEWDKVQQTDRLTGPSLTGWKDAIGYLNYTDEQEAELLRKLNAAVKEEGNTYCRFLRIAEPLLDTTIKPEGTLSQVAGGVSSGLHMAHSPFYIRRVRINSADPLAKTVQAQGWKISAENGTPGATPEEKLANAKKWVVSFPQKSGAKRTKDEISVKEQFDTYFRFQENYTSHNSSNTITVKPPEWEEAEQIVWDNWDRFTAVSFLSHDGGTYQQAPYESISEELYNKMVSEEIPLDEELLKSFETIIGSDLDGADGCDTGYCPIR